MSFDANANYMELHCVLCKLIELDEPLFWPWCLFMLWSDYDAWLSSQIITRTGKCTKFPYWLVRWFVTPTSNNWQWFWVETGTELFFFVQYRLLWNVTFIGYLLCSWLLRCSLLMLISHLCFHLTNMFCCNFQIAVPVWTHVLPLFCFWHTTGPMITEKHDKHMSANFHVDSA